MTGRPPLHRFVRRAARQWSLHLLAIEVGANVHVIWFTQLGVTRCDGDHGKDVFSERAA
jgi:hypothetical protein